MLYRVRSASEQGIGVSWQVKSPSALQSPRFLFLPVAVHQPPRVLPVCLLGGGQTLTLNPPGTGILSLSRRVSGGGGGVCPGLGVSPKLPAGRGPALWAPGSRRTCKM